MKSMRIKIVLLLTGTMIFLFFYVVVLEGVGRNNKSEEQEYNSITKLGTAEEYEDPYNLSLHCDTGGDLLLEEDEQFDNIVFCDNIADLVETDLTIYGINSLEEYMLRYLNYYLGESEYHISVSDYRADANFPSFTAKLEGTSYLIRCTYNKATCRYHFHCKEIDGRRKEVRNTEETTNRVNIPVEIN